MMRMQAVLWEEPRQDNGTDNRQSRVLPLSARSIKKGGPKPSRSFADQAHSLCTARFICLRLDPRQSRLTRSEAL
jgi:hypothetical protein